MSLYTVTVTVILWVLYMLEVRWCTLLVPLHAFTPQQLGDFGVGPPEYPLLSLEGVVIVPTQPPCWCEPFLVSVLVCCMLCCAVLFGHTRAPAC